MTSDPLSPSFQKRVKIHIFPDTPLNIPALIRNTKNPQHLHNTGVGQVHFRPFSGPQALFCEETWDVQAGELVREEYADGADPDNSDWGFFRGLWYDHFGYIAANTN